MNISIESAKSDDFGFLIDAIERYYEYDGIRFDRVRIHQGLRLLLSREDLGHAWVIRVDGVDVGYAIIGFGFDLEFGGRQATLTDLFIDPRHRRQGLGLAVLERIERACAAWNVNAIELQVETDNLEALGLYERRGFVRHTRIPMSKRINSQG